MPCVQSPFLRFRFFGNDCVIKTAFPCGVYQMEKEPNNTHFLRTVWLLLPFPAPNYAGVVYLCSNVVLQRKAAGESLTVTICSIPVMEHTIPPRNDYFFCVLSRGAQFNRSFQPNTKISGIYSIIHKIHIRQVQPPPSCIDASAHLLPHLQVLPCQRILFHQW